MAVTTYHYMSGRLVSEDRGGTLRSYRTDGFGSTAQMVNTSATVTDSFRFDFFGNEVSRTGSTPTPMRWRNSTYQFVLMNYYSQNPAYSTILGFTLQDSTPFQAPTLPYEKLPKCGSSYGQFLGRCLLNWSARLTEDEVSLERQGGRCDPKADCESIKKRMKFVCSIADGMKSGTNPPQNEKEFRPWGVTCCCIEKDKKGRNIVKAISFYFPPRESNSAGFNWWSWGPQSWCEWECLLVHEKKHRDRRKEDAKRCSELYENVAERSKKINEEEKFAWEAECDCLKRKLDGLLDKDGNCIKDNTICSL